MLHLQSMNLPRYAYFFAGLLLPFSQIILGAGFTWKKYVRTTIPASGWTPTESISSVGNSVACASVASARNRYFFNFDEGQGTCEVGDVDLAGMGSGELQIMMEDLTSSGLSFGDAGSGVDFEVILPEGNICPAPDHGIPPNDLIELKKDSLMAEVGGVLYLGAGFLMNNTVSRAFFSLDLTAPSPVWVQRENMPRAGWTAPEGLVAHVDGAGRAYIFAVFQWLCNENLDRLYRYDVELDSWETVGRISPTSAVGGIASDGDLLFIAGGKDCVDNEPLPTIQAFDMSRPNEDAVVSQETFCASGPVFWPACTVMRLNGGSTRKGLLCAGGGGPSGFTTGVQFLPIVPGTNELGPCEVLTPLPRSAYKGRLFNFGNGRTLLYNFAAGAKILEWDQGEEEFVDMGTTTTGNLLARYGHISSRYIMRNCWKYLV